MRRTILAAMITMFVLICCVSSSWAFWPFTGDDQRKTHESLDVVIETGSENAKEVRDSRADVRKAKEDIQKDLQRGFGGLTEEIKKANTVKPILIALGLTLVGILIILILVIVFSRKKFPEGNSVKFFPTEQGGKCSLCSRTVKPENWKRHLRRSKCKEVGEKMGKKVELILA